MSCRVKSKCFVPAASTAVLSVIMFYCAPLVHASGDQQPAEPNDLRWDLAEDFEVRWTAVQLSAKVVGGVTPNSLTRELIISAEFRILDTEGLVTVERERPRIVKVSDGRGNAVPWRFEQGSAARWYEDMIWPWHPGQIGPWNPFTLTLRLPDDPNIPTPSSLGTIEAYVYGLCGDDVVSLDIPFDPNSGWHEPKAVPDLQICVDPATPPCPKRLRYVPVSLLPGSSKGSGAFPYRSTTPVPLYRYTTWVRSKSGAPVMALRDKTWYCYRDIYPLGEYAVLRTELYDSVQQISVNVSTQEIGSGVSDVRGTYCSAEMEQGRYDAYDTIRHVVVVHPTEVKIPFVLRNIPVPIMQPKSREGEGGALTEG